MTVAPNSLSTASFASGPQRPAATITIPEASLIIDGNGKQHVVYTVRIRGPGIHRQVMKKFSEFRTFDTVWRSKYPSVSATLPPKAWLQNKSEKVMAERQVRLEIYLNALAEIVSVVPYLAKFLGVAVDAIRPPRTASDGTDPIVTHHRRRRNSGAPSQSNSGGVRSSETDSFTTSVQTRAQTFTARTQRSEDGSRAEVARSTAESGEGRAVTRSPVRRAEFAITRTLTDSINNSTAAAIPPTPPMSRPAATASVADAGPVDFHGVLLMALEAVLAGGGGQEAGAGGLAGTLIEDDGDFGAVLDRDWDLGGPPPVSTAASGLEFIT